MNKFLHPFLFGMLLLPLASTWHECGHYLMAIVFGAHPQLHWAFVFTPESDQLTRLAQFCIKAGGPLMDAWCVAVGLLWLSRSRPRGIPAKTDWLAFALVQRAVAPLLGIEMLLFGRDGLPDEAKMSLLLGCSKWTLPCVLSLLWVSALVAALRLLPKGYRLLPFVGMHLGGFFGCGVVHLLIR
jgi:hypothetical protein